MKISPKPSPLSSPGHLWLHFILSGTSQSPPSLQLAIFWGPLLKPPDWFWDTPPYHPILKVQPITPWVLLRDGSFSLNSRWIFNRYIHLCTQFFGSVCMYVNGFKHPMANTVWILPSRICNEVTVVLTVNLINSLCKCCISQWLSAAKSSRQSWGLVWTLDLAP